MTKTAYLRVYSPEISPTHDPVPGFVRSYGLLSEQEGSDDWVAEWEGRRVVCPRSLRLRVLESTVAFANAFRGLGAGLVPEEAARAADRELRVVLRDHPERRSQVLTSAWHVPVRWFSGFAPEDKEVYEVEAHPRVRYRVGLTTARDRIHHVLGVLRGLEVFHGPAEDLAQLSGWLDQFSDDSMLELDYADVSDLFDPAELVLDDTVEMIHASIEALENADMLRAGEFYGRVVSRWAPAFSVTFSN